MENNTNINFYLDKHDATTDSDIKFYDIWECFYDNENENFYYLSTGMEYKENGILIRYLEDYDRTPDSPKYNLNKISIDGKDIREIFKEEIIKQFGIEALFYDHTLEDCMTDKMYDFVLDKLNKRGNRTKEPFVTVKSKELDSKSSKDIFFESIKEAIKNKQNCVMISGRKVFFERIPCSDLILIDDCVIDLKNKKMIGYNETTKDKIVESLEQTK